MERNTQKQKRKQEKLLIEGCKVMAEESMKINKEWEIADSELDWEWDATLSYLNLH